MYFHICTCDDVTLVNEKSIVSGKYMKSNKKCVFNVNFQYIHKQVPTNLFNVKTVSWKLFKFYYRSKTTTIANFILNEIKRSISISVYYGWKRSIKNGRWREIDLKIIFWLQISFLTLSGISCVTILKHNNIVRSIFYSCLFQ
jgi:hypothetical protein